jgi:hypothetical protein
MSACRAILNEKISYCELPICYLDAGLYVTVTNGAFTVIFPKWTFLDQVNLVKPKEVVGEKAFQSRKKLVVVERVHGVYITQAVVNISLQL